ncbi:MAG: LON peptidase substrate-binding domain-containing protein [Gammaproteobacteria bacterium]|nr:LON peptidase substrate-binding domain-containing protein [Gammaproteobacteria bacterium]MDH5260087.1 LON peptidase substrate-binding domain-containing protein [Gammaproteobacteria bacterium]
MRIPIFPLNTVLFPGGPLPLRIFEPRYIDMVSACMKSDSPFGVLLIRHGNEVGPATTFEVGTLAKITDFYQGSDGLLGITAIGLQRFRLLSISRQSDGLNMGEVELIPPENPMRLPDEYSVLPHMLGNVLGDLGRLYEVTDWRLDDAVWVGYRFLEILPIDLEQKQASLESSDTAGRLRLVDALLDTVRRQG